MSMRPEWHERAACRGMVDVFFSEHGDGASVRKAKEVCASCPVFKECREYVENNYERYGIWAGQSADTFNRRHGPRELKHGSWTMLRRGCECDVCVDYRRSEARRTYQLRKNRVIVRRTREFENRTHGLTATYQDGCRCRLCRDAKAEYMRQFRAKRRSEVA